MKFEDIEVDDIVIYTGTGPDYLGRVTMKNEHEGVNLISLDDDKIVTTDYKHINLLELEPKYKLKKQFETEMQEIIHSTEGGSRSEDG